MKHILTSQQFSLEDVSSVFRRTQEFRDAFSDPAGLKNIQDLYPQRALLSVFYEPSTRTRLSFVLAAQNLGMKVAWTENARDFSSAIKGETLEDSVHVLCEYKPSVIVLRHFDEGAAERASVVADKYGVSIVNAGDGAGQHPTQALLDLFTIYDEVGRLNKLTVVLGGRSCAWQDSTVTRISSFEV